MVYDYDASRWENARSIKLRFNLHHYQNRHSELLKRFKNLSAQLASRHCGLL